MADESTFANVQNDLAPRDFAKIASLHKENIARPDRRQHAVSSDLKTQNAEASQRFSGKLTFQRVLFAVWRIAYALHETFLLRIQPLCVA